MIASLRRSVALAFFAATLAPLSAFAQQQPKEVKQATHGDWEIICVEGTDICRMEQYGKANDAQRALLVRLQRVSGVATNEGGQVPALISMLSPLGVLLPYSLRVQIDSGAQKRLPFERCLPQGCLAAGPMTDETVAELKRGNTMSVEFVFERKETAQVSLRGFTKAYNSLKPIPAKQSR
ncbi:MAG: invasion associated locus B family protein [Pseudomonadota bacterium]